MPDTSWPAAPPRPFDLLPTAAFWALNFSIAERSPFDMAEALMAAAALWCARPSLAAEAQSVPRPFAGPAPTDR